MKLDVMILSDCKYCGKNGGHDFIGEIEPGIIWPQNELFLWVYAISVVTLIIIAMYLLVLW